MRYELQEGELECGNPHCANVGVDPELSVERGQSVTYFCSKKCLNEFIQIEHDDYMEAVGKGK